MSNEPADQQGAWTAREFTDRERNRWLARKGEFDWLLIAPDGVQFGPMFEVSATALVSILESQRIHLTALETENAALRGQLDAYWRQYRSCPCGARGESPSAFPHVPGCPTEKALSRLSSTGGDK